MPEVSHVESDLHCVQCGYNLRTLARGASCPECGAALSVSTIPDVLAITDFRTIRLLPAALRLFVAGIALYTVGDLARFLFRDLGVILAFLTLPPGILLCAAALILFLITAIRVGNRWLWILYALVAMGIWALNAQTAMRLFFNSNFCTQADRDALSDAMRIEGLGRSLVCLFFLFWIAGCFRPLAIEIQKRLVLAFLFMWGAVAAAVLMFVEPAVLLLDKPLGGLFTTPLFFANDIAGVALIVIIVWLRRRIPALRQAPSAGRIQC
ncbi:MAG TPA: hypothetical protein P5081_19265 [Phycisphaerae bacterium]|nr:hypothetical protein [Phycisphaerae bacterium]HRW55015.1 hypothetical protein [Phycisphaerae bacterium]